jgi:hypothetical protein
VGAGFLAGVDSGSDDLDSVMDSLVVLRLQVTVSNDESINEYERVKFQKIKCAPDCVVVGCLGHQ